MNTLREKGEELEELMSDPKIAREQWLNKYYDRLRGALQNIRADEGLRFSIDPSEDRNSLEIYITLNDLWNIELESMRSEFKLIFFCNKKNLIDVYYRYPDAPIMNGYIEGEREKIRTLDFNDFNNSTLISILETFYDKSIQFMEDMQPVKDSE